MARQSQVRHLSGVTNDGAAGWRPRFAIPHCEALHLPVRELRQPHLAEETVAVLETVGLLDESLFFYFEDMDWCLRAGRAGFLVLVVPAATSPEFLATGRYALAAFPCFAAGAGLLCPPERPLARLTAAWLTMSAAAALVMVSAYARWYLL